MVIINSNLAETNRDQMLILRILLTCHDEAHHDVDDDETMNADGDWASNVIVARCCVDADFDDCIA